MQGFNKGFLYFICAVSAMGGLLFGYDWVVIGGAKPFYELYFGIADSPLMQGVAMTTALVGCLIGAMVAGGAADKYGRKPLLTFSAVLFTVSAIATGLFNDFTLFNIARFVGGVGIGVASALSPMYIAEVSPAGIRGRMVSLNQMTIVLGILAAQIVNMLLARDTTVAENMAWNVEWGWRWMFWAETLPAALFLFMSFFIPESPVFLKLKKASPPTPLQRERGVITFSAEEVSTPPSPRRGVGGEFFFSFRNTGLSGIKKLRMRNSPAGIASAQNIQRQAHSRPQFSSTPVPISIFMICAERIPRTIVIWFRLTMRPRISAGLTSAIYIGASALAMPMPIPPMKRAILNIIKSSYHPVARALTVNSTAESIRRGFLP